MKYFSEIVNSADLTGWQGGHGVFISGQGQGAVDNPPVSLQWNVPTVAALVELLYGGDELITVDPANDGGQAGHQTHGVLRPGELQAAHQLPLLCLQVVELGAGQDLVLLAEAARHEDPGAGLQLYEETGVVSPGRQHGGDLCPAVTRRLQLVDLVQAVGCIVETSELVNKVLRHPGIFPH